MTLSRPLLLLSVLLLIKAALLILFILKGPVGLGPDEAQYWTWSQQLDWGYYSKPPGIAWQIGLGTALFGDTELGVRFFAVIAGSLLPFALYLLAKSCKFTSQTAFWSALLFAMAPFGMAASFLAITDTVMVLAWTLALALLASSLTHETPPRYLLMGLVIAVGALFKWPIYLLWCFIIGMLPIFSFLRRYSLVVGILISFVGLVPSYLWNHTHDWATFRHVFHQVEGSPLAAEHRLGVFQGNFFEFIGSQIALLSPLLFLAFGYSLWRFISAPKQLPRPALFLGSITLFIFGGFLFLSMFKKVQGNWGDFAYPSGIVFTAWIFCEQRSNWRRWLSISAVTSLFLIMGMLSIPSLQSYSIGNIPYKINPFRHNVGWKTLDAHLIESGYNVSDNFIFSSKYQMSSILSFYGPEQRRAYFFNIHGIRKNQFSFWPGMPEEQIGKDGFYVIAENQPHLNSHMEQIPHYIELLSPYFTKVEFVRMAPLFEANGTIAKGALIFKGTNYNGKVPEESDRW